MGLKAGFLGFFVFVWLIGAILGSTFELHDTPDTWFGTGTGGYEQSPISTIEYLTDITNVVQKTKMLGGIPMIVPNQDYFSTMGDILMWKFSFLFDASGDMAYGLIYYVFFMPFAIMGMLSVVLIGYGLVTGNLSIT